jgi:hypothetical protein
MTFSWTGDSRFARAVGHGLDLRAGLLFDRLVWGWLVYDGTTLERVAWGEARSMLGAQVQAETCARRSTREAA